MNTVVSAASLATASAVAAPAIVSEPDHVLLELGRTLDQGVATFNRCQHQDIAGLSETEIQAIDKIQMDALTDEIFYEIGRSDAHTMDGYYVKACAVAQANRWQWEKPFEDLDWGPKNMRMLVESIFKARGQCTVEDYLQQHLSKKQVPVTSTEPKLHPDAELLGLVEQFITADREYREAALVVDRMNDECRSSRCQSPLPEVLRWRQGDFDLGLPPILKGTAYGPNWEHSLSVNQLRKEKWLTGTTTIFKPGKNELILHWTTPTEAALSRADEIIRAYDEWHKNEVAPPPRGYKRAEKAREKADRAASKLENKVLHTCATTIDGMLAKIRCAQSQALFYDGRLPPVEELEELETIAGSAQYVAESLFRDLWQLALSGVHDRSVLVVDVVAAPPGEPSRDPIFAAIEAHRLAYEYFQNDRSDDDDALIAADDAADVLVETEPTTIAGAAALLTYFSERTIRDNTYFRERYADEKGGEAIPFAAKLAQVVSRAISKSVPLSAPGARKSRRASMSV